MLLNSRMFSYKPASECGADLFQKTLNAVALSVFLLCPLWVNADGLFNFQMKLAEKGNNPEAEYKVGEMYETGFGVEKDLKEARKWIDKAAAKGHETASFKLLYWDIEKNGLTSENKPKFEELKTKASAENLQAMYYIGLMYSRGVGLNKNHKKALKWLDKAAFLGLLSAEREAENIDRLQRKNKQNKAVAKAKKAPAAVAKKPVVLTEAEKKKQRKLKQEARLREYSKLLKKEAELAKQAEAKAKK